MSGYLLDTNVVSELTRPAPDQNVTVFVATHGDLWLNSIVVYELEYGLLSTPAGRRREQMLAANARIMRAFEDRVLALNKAGAEWAARFRANAKRQGQALELADALIAGTTMANELTLVTRNVRHFEGLGFQVINPWEQAST